jgi:hypothetical protein
MFDPSGLGTWKNPMQKPVEKLMNLMKKMPSIKKVLLSEAF